jgi:hypothetical protein
MKPLVLRPSSGIFVTVSIWVVGVVIIGTLVLVGDGPGSELWPMAPTVGAIAWLTWVLLWWPCVRVAGEGVEVRNPLRTVRIPWSSIVDLDSRGTLVIETPGRRVKAWAAPPAISSQHRRMSLFAAARARLRANSNAPKDDPSADPDVADIIRRVQTGRYRLPMTEEPYETVTASWNILVIAVTLVAVVGAVVVLL